MKILIIDNFDSFTYNLVQMLGKYKKELRIFRNDENRIEIIKEFRPEKIIISPGPGRPENSGLSLDIIKEFGISVQILGVCLGMQAICHLFGAEIVISKQIYHGKISKIEHDNKTIFTNVPQNFDAMRYHSLIVNECTLPDEIEISAKTVANEIMGIRHKVYAIEGIQFHPESILTASGKQIIDNWLNL